jgi:hypothetical protein
MGLINQPVGGPNGGTAATVPYDKNFFSRQGNRKGYPYNPTETRQCLVSTFPPGMPQDT